MTDTPRLGLPYLAASQYQKEVFVNVGSDRLDLLCQCAVLDRNLTAPPASPALGDAYIVGPAPTDAWAGHANELALWVSSQWELIAPLPGFQCWVIDEAVLVYWSGTAWTIVTGAGGGATTFLGLTDTPDTYSGQAGKTLLVNPGETALEFGTTAGSAPVDAPYVVTAPHTLLSAERVVTDTTAILWDTTTAGQLKATIAPEGVTLDNLVHQAQGTLLGRGDTLSPTDTVQALTVGPGLLLEGTTLSATGGVSTFLGLTDTPDAYTGQAGKAVVVNAGASALEFGTAEAGASDFLALTDTPDTYSGQASKVVAVNALSTALEFVPAGSNAALGAEVQRVATFGVVQNTNVPVVWDTEVRDDAAFWASGAATRLTIPSAGWYSLTAFIQWDATTGVTRIVNVRVNGTQYIATESVPAAGVDQRQTIAVNWYLGAGDYLEIVLFQSTAGTRQVTGNCTVVGLTAAPAPTSTFLALTDTPDTYSGQAGTLLRVNAGATATEFAAMTTVVPAGSETVSGRLELATVAETTTGTDTTRATHPAGVKAALDGRVPAGTALSVARYASGGVNLETTLLSLDASTNLLLGTPLTAGTSLTKGLVVGSGVAPSAAHPADAVQMWVADMEGTAGQAALHLRSEDGWLVRLGNGILGKMRTRPVSTNPAASPLTLTLDMSGMYFISNAAAQQYLQLPAITNAHLGVYYTVSSHGAGGTRLIAGTGATIQLAASVSTSGGFVQTTTAGNYLEIRAANGNYWMCTSPVQNWTVG